MKKYRYELHSHTSEVSGCARICAAESARLHIEAGYDGLVVTDHFYADRLNDFGGSWKNRIDCYLTGYNILREAAGKHDFSILLGLEYRFVGESNDFLIYGITPQLLYNSPDIDRLDHAGLRDFADANALLIVQAHPFRSMCSRVEPPFIDGIEVFNGNPRHHSHNDDALEFAERRSLIKTSGSDFHELEDLGRGGILCDAPLRSEKQLVELLRSGNYSLIRIDE